MIRVGLIGCGTHGRQAVVPAIVEHSNRCELVAVADHVAENTAQVEVPGVARYREATEMFRGTALDVVYVATLCQTHAELTVAALEAGLHVVCEKPMAASVEECRAMVAAAEAADRRLVIDFESRYLGHYQQIRQWVSDGDLGEVAAIHLQNFWDGHKTFGPLADRRARLMERAGGMDCGIHKLDLARYLTGGGNWAELQALGAWLGESFTPPPHISILGRLDNDVLATVNVSMGYAASIEPRPMQDLVTVVGTRGVASLSVDVGSPKAFHSTSAEACLYSERKVERCRVEHVGHAVVIGRLLDDVAEAIASGGSPSEHLPTGVDGLQAQIAVEWANREAQEARQRASRPTGVGEEAGTRG